MPGRWMQQRAIALNGSGTPISWDTQQQRMLGITLLTCNNFSPNPVLAGFEQIWRASKLDSGRNREGTCDTFKANGATECFINCWQSYKAYQCTMVVFLNNRAANV